MPVFLASVLEQNVIHIVINQESKSIKVFINKNITKVWYFLTKQEPLSLFCKLKEPVVTTFGQPKGLDTDQFIVGKRFV